MRFIITILFAFICFAGYSQNLVSNGSFENYSAIPDDVGHLNNSSSWFNPSTASPDYFHIECPYVNLFSATIPQNGMGYQFPRTGKAYAGQWLFVKQMPAWDYREYLCTNLLQTLIAGKDYCINVYVSLGDSAQYSCGNYGLYFSTTYNFYPIQTAIPVIQQFENNSTNQLNNKINWMHIQGTYTAIGGEQYVYFGNFKTNANSDSILIDSLSAYPGAYYYIDDVSLYECNAPVYTADAGDSIKICAGGPATLGTHNLPQYLYYWYSDPARTDTLFTIANPTVYPTVTTTYYLEVIDFKFDRSYDSVTVYVYPSIPDSLISAGNDTSFCPGGSVQLGNAGGSYTYLWQPSGGLNNDAISNPICTPLQSTTYVLYASNPGCTRNDTVTVIVEDCDTAENSLNIINAFTPNNDGKNDYFHIKGTNVSTVHLKIINRWGQQLYEGMGENVKWDGRYDGNDVSAGVYYYIAEVIFADGTTQSKRGAVHLIH